MSRGKVFIIDDDSSVRKALSLLLKSHGYLVETFESATDFFSMPAYKDVGCILLDIFMHSESGLELQDKITQEFYTLPIIYITGQGDVPMSVQALKKGAINFLQKPVDQALLVVAIEEALAKSQKIISSYRETAKYKLLIDKLTAREFEIFENIITGALNKQIAAKLNITEHTVKLHRGRITEKLGVKSAAEMVYIAEKLNILS